MWSRYIYLAPWDAAQLPDPPVHRLSVAFSVLSVLARREFDFVKDPLCESQKHRNSYIRTPGATWSAKSRQSVLISLKLEFWKLGDAPFSRASGKKQEETTRSPGMIGPGPTYTFDKRIAQWPSTGDSSLLLHLPWIPAHLKLP